MGDSHAYATFSPPLRGSVGMWPGGGAVGIESWVEWSGWPEGWRKIMMGRNFSRAKGKGAIGILDGDFS